MPIEYHPESLVLRFWRLILLSSQEYRDIQKNVFHRKTRSSEYTYLCVALLTPIKC